MFSIVRSVLLGGTNRMKRIGSYIGVSTVVLSFMFATAAAPVMAQDWPMFGQDATNAATNSSSISTNNVSQLKPKWTFTTGGDVSARAAVVSGVAYFPDWAGNLWAVNAKQGKLIWSHQLSDYGIAREHTCPFDSGRKGRHSLHRNPGRRLAVGDQGQQGHPALEDSTGNNGPLRHHYHLADGAG